MDTSLLDGPWRPGYIGGSGLGNLFSYMVPSDSARKGLYSGRTNGWLVSWQVFSIDCMNWRVLACMMRLRQSLL